MKELLTVNANFHAVWSENDKPIPQVEVVLVTSEPTYTVDAAGQVISQRTTDAFRFAASPAALRKLAESLVKLAIEGEQLRWANPKD